MKDVDLYSRSMISISGSGTRLNYRFIQSATSTVLSHLTSFSTGVFPCVRSCSFSELLLQWTLRPLRSKGFLRFFPFTFLFSRHPFIPGRCCCISGKYIKIRSTVCLKYPARAAHNTQYAALAVHISRKILKSNPLVRYRRHVHCC